MSRFERAAGSWPAGRRMLAGLLALAAMSGCSEGPTAASVGRASLALAPVFEAAPPAGAAGIQSVRILVKRLDGSAALDVTQALEGGSRRVDLEVSVEFDLPSEVLSVEITVLDPQGGVVFQGGPVEVTVGGGAGANLLEVPIVLVATPPVLAVDEYCSDFFGAAIGTFADPTVEAGVRAGLGVGPNEDLTCSLLSTLTSLTIGIPETIGSLDGVQNLTGLTTLNLNNTQNISDLGPLSGLTSLTGLHIRGNQITDVSPLSGLTGLTQLNLAVNAIQDVSPLAGLVNLVFLAINENQISDISALAGLTKLEQSFWIGRNPISDISVVSGFTTLVRLYAFEALITDIGPLAGLTNLSTVQLSQNAGLSDVQALLNNPGIGTGDIVTLIGTSVACADVDALRARGVTVSSGCPVPPPPPVPAIVAITQSPGGVPVPLQNVTGQIDVHVAMNVPVDLPTSGVGLQLLLDGNVIGVQDFSGALSGTYMVAFFVDTTLYSNGEHELMARLEVCDPGGCTSGRSAVIITLNN